MSDHTRHPETILRRQWTQTLKQVTSGDIEQAAIAILRLPDKLAGHRDAAEIDYRYLADYLSSVDSPTPLARTLKHLLAGLCLYRAGDVEGSLTSFQQARRDATRITDERRAGFLTVPIACGEAWSLMRSAKGAQGARRARAAVALADEIGSPWLTAHARHALGRVLAADTGQRTRALALLDGARSGYLAPEVHDLRGAGHCLQIAGRLRADSGDVQAGLADMQEALGLMRRSHAARGTAGVLLDMGWVHTYQQSHALARSLGREALDILAPLSDGRGLAKAHHLVGWTFLCEGRLREADASFLRAHEHCSELRSPSLGIACSYYLARCAFMMGDDTDCAGHLATCAELSGYDALADLGVQALTAARHIRRHQWRKADGLLHRLTGDLEAAAVNRLEADSLFLCGFELCRADRLEQAAPLLRRALEVASEAQATAAVQGFLAAREGVGLERWMATLVSTLADRAHIQQQLVDQATAAAYGFHDLCNAATSVHSQLALYESFPEEVNVPAVAQEAYDVAEFARQLCGSFQEGRDTLKPQLKPFDVAAFIRDRETIGNRVHAGGLTYHSEIEPDLPQPMADPRAMARIFNNLTSNAEKYATDSHITLSARARRNAAGEAAAVVIGFGDTGPGIHPQDLEIIFTPKKHPSQYRVKRRNHGAGLGLGYCRLVVEAHGGRIWARSTLEDKSRPEQEHGTTFYIELPVTGKPKRST